MSFEAERMVRATGFDSPVDKNVLRSIAHQAEHNWDCYKGSTAIDHLVSETAFKRTAIIESMKRLVAWGILVVVDKLNGRATEYRIDHTKIGDGFHYGNQSVRRTGPPDKPVRETDGYQSGRRTQTSPLDVPVPVRETDRSIYKETQSTNHSNLPIGGGAVLVVSGSPDSLVEPVRKVLARWVAAGLKGVSVDDGTVREFARQLSVARITADLLEKREEAAVAGLHFGLSASELVAKLKPYVKVPAAVVASGQPPIVDVVETEQKPVLSKEQLASLKASRRGKKFGSLGVAS